LPFGLVEFSVVRDPQINQVLKVEQSRATEFGKGFRLQAKLLLAYA